MEALSDDDYERVSDIDVSDYESEQDDSDHETPSSSPPSTRIFRASDRKTIRCTYDGCPKTFNRKARLEEHLRSHTNTRIFRCQHEGCGKDFLRETHLKHHLKSAHSNIRDYKCTWEGCDKSFATGTRLRRHLQAHEGREKYRCRGYAGCSQTFRKHETLKRHILQVHEQMKPFACNETVLKTGNQCEQAFDTAEKLRAHQRAKHDNTRFSCTECLMRAPKNTENLTAPSDQQFDALFATYSDLQAHIAEFHPPTCSHCQASFTTQKELTRHLELQHGIFDSTSASSNMFQCTSAGCNRTFTKKGNLNVHIKTVHEKKKDFVCGETEVSLPEELQAGEALEIEGCGRAYTSKASLEDHIRTAHLGLTSLQMERKKKRKAERREADQPCTNIEPRTRRSRKDKGVKKVSILDGLSGRSVQTQHNHYLPLDPALAGPSYSHATQDSDVNANVKRESDIEDDEWNQLSGSMVLLDNHLYHNGEQYEYTVSHYPPDLALPQKDEQAVFDSQFDTAYNRVYGRINSQSDDEPFFGGFEHEPESMQGVRDASFPTLGTGY